MNNSNEPRKIKRKMPCIKFTFPPLDVPNSTVDKMAVMEILPRIMYADVTDMINDKMESMNANPYRST